MKIDLTQFLDNVYMKAKSIQQEPYSTSPSLMFNYLVTKKNKKNIKFTRSMNN